MTVWTHQDIQRALNRQENQEAWQAKGLSIDTRSLQKGDLYIAIKGDQHDGHTFVKEAFNKGAVAAIVEWQVEEGGRQLIVPNTLEALQKLGRYARERSSARVIAITGSVGKTTTKEMLRQVLAVFGLTAYSPSSYNNHWGVPLSLARMGTNTCFGVMEIGMNHTGEIAPLAEMIQPNAAVITHIGEAHIGYLGSQESIAKEKAEIFSGLKPTGIAILNRDDNQYPLLAGSAYSRGVKRIIKFGKHAEADVRLISYQPNPSGCGGWVTAQVGQQELRYTLLLPGEHSAFNSLIVIALAQAWELDLRQVLPILSTILPPPGRGQHHILALPERGSITLIDDAYNANPTSMKAGLQVLASMPGRHIAVIGQMGELGERSAQYHADLLPYVQEANVDLVFATGENARYLYEKIPPNCQGGYASTAQELIPTVRAALQPGDVIFVKGSKSTRVSQVVEALLAELAPSTPRLAT